MKVSSKSPPSPRPAKPGSNAEQVSLRLRSWRRPSFPPDFSPKKDDLVLQQLVIDYSVVSTLTATARTDVPFPVIRIFCNSEQGQSVLVNAYGFEPYFFVEAPEGFAPASCREFQSELEAAFKASHLSPGVRHVNTTKPHVQSVEYVMGNTIMGYHPDDSQKAFLKVTCTLPNQVPVLRDLLESGCVWHGTELRTYEANILFPLRFLVDTKMVGCSWLRLPAGAYALTDKRYARSTCQLEVDVHYTRIRYLGVDGEWEKVAPFRVLTFDVTESAGRTVLISVYMHVFGEHLLLDELRHSQLIQQQQQQQQRVSQVTQITLPTQPFQQIRIQRPNISFVLGESAPAVGVEIISFDTEEELLAGFREFVLTADPDVIAGFKVSDVVIPALAARGRAFRMPGFDNWGRIRSSFFSTQVFTGGSGSNEDAGLPDGEEKEAAPTSPFAAAVKGLRLTGRILIDLYRVMRSERRLSTLSLGSAAAAVLGEQREVLGAGDIAELCAGAPEDRQRLALYGIRNAETMMQLCEKLMTLYNDIEIARVTGVPLTYVRDYGAEIKAISQVYRRARERGLLVPYVRRVEGDYVYVGGAAHIDPIVGYHDSPVATLDFASLYPSIIISNNLCYTTHLPADPEARAALCPPQDCMCSPSGEYFVKKSVRLGLLPEILQSLLDARKRAKTLLADEKDPVRRAVLHRRQLALKGCANSIYGIAGSHHGRLPMFEITSSVIEFGRQMVATTRAFIEETYSVRNGFPHNAHVIYGDTDSFMVRFEVPTVREAIALGKEAAERVTKLFSAPVRLAFEKVYCPYLIEANKNYAGLLWTDADRPPVIESKGLETIRLSACPLVKFTLDNCLEMIFVRRDIRAVKAFVKRIIAALLQGKLDTSLLVLTRALHRDEDQYDSHQAHVELVRKMRKLDPNYAIGYHERIPYVIVKSTVDTRLYQKSEDPIIALQKDLPLDHTYYIEHQLRKPLTRLLKPVLGKDPASLFAGSHVMKVTLHSAAPDLDVTTSNNSSSSSSSSSSDSGKNKKAKKRKTGNGISSDSSKSIMCSIDRFFKKTLLCLSCKQTLEPGQKTICNVCREHGKELETYFRCVELVKVLEQRYSRVWTQCQKCTGYFMRKTICIK